MKKLLICIIVLNLSACASVKPWQKGNLAKKEMSWDPDSLQRSMNSQVQASKEASRGGYGSAGGGCGCN
ncbi:DUF4266 domain-containing protein [Colwellia sp. E2M01]|uniref:DUF4266 domain-containing protein n=1 Tax=Colwellia sp. E2M01 TaxID=2841561 RepID=UPI001C0A2429|nr:DUF4266 domain-containing protein [Colwellia sp. E2M01]MBU2870668.1 DUF4266 domain-containing protein [Colwellia sp. E2M01]